MTATVSSVLIVYSPLTQGSTPEISLDLSSGQAAIPHDLESVSSQRSRSRLDTASSLSDDQMLDADGQNLSGDNKGLKGENWHGLYPSYLFFIF